MFERIIKCSTYKSVQRQALEYLLKGTVLFICCFTAIVQLKRKLKAVIYVFWLKVRTLKSVLPFEISIELNCLSCCVAIGMTNCIAISNSTFPSFNLYLCNIL